MTIEPEKRPLLLGLAAASVSLVLRLRWPPTPRIDAAWALLLLVSAGSLVWFERLMTRSGRPLRPLRWVAGGLAILMLAQLGYLFARR